MDVQSLAVLLRALALLSHPMVTASCSATSMGWRTRLLGKGLVHDRG